jgi:hypothetical protein
LQFLLEFSTLKPSHVDEVVISADAGNFSSGTPPDFTHRMMRGELMPWWLWKREAEMMLCVLKNFWRCIPYGERRSPAPVGLFKIRGFSSPRSWG